MKARPTFQFLGIGVVGLILGLILIAAAIGNDARGAMTLQRPAVGLIGFGCVVVGGCCLVAGAAFGVSGVDRSGKKDDHDKKDTAV